MNAGMHTAHRPIFAPALMLATALNGLLVAVVAASPIPSSYSADGVVGPSNTGEVTLNSRPLSQPLVTPGTVNLGTFQVQSLPEGASVTYHDMPFQNLG